MEKLSALENYSLGFSDINRPNRVCFAVNLPKSLISAVEFSDTLD